MKVYPEALPETFTEVSAFSSQLQTAPAAPGSVYLWGAGCGGWKSTLTVPGLLLNPLPMGLLICSHC